MLVLPYDRRNYVDITKDYFALREGYVLLLDLIVTFGKLYLLLLMLGGFFLQVNNLENTEELWRTVYTNI